MGLPQETEETLGETISLAKKLPLDIALFHTAIPYPGTTFYLQSIEKGWLTTFDWSRFDMNDSVVVSYPQLEGGAILNEVKKAYRKFYLRPKQIWRLLKMFRSSRDFRPLFQIARDFLTWLFPMREAKYGPDRSLGEGSGMGQDKAPVVEPTHTGSRHTNINRERGGKGSLPK